MNNFIHPIPDADRYSCHRNYQRHALSVAVGLAWLVSSLNTFGLVYSENFDNGTASGFEGITTLVDVPSGFMPFGFSGKMLLNGAEGNPAPATILRLQNLPPHDAVSINFDLAIIDSWDGSTQLGGVISRDEFHVTLDGRSIFIGTFDNFRLDDQTVPNSATRLSWGSQLGYIGSTSGGLGNDLGGIDFGTITYYDSAYRVALPFLAHSGPSLSLEFFSGGGGYQGGPDEEWAIDNASITLAEVPEPSAYAGVTGLGLLGLCLFRQMRRALGKGHLTSPPPIGVC